jgi:uncharacterized membrane protein YfcA
MQDSDCNNKYFVCRSDDLCQGVTSCCVHKSVFQPKAFMLEYVGLAVFTLVMALCNIAGIGGGGIAIPLIMAFFKFDTKVAVAISSFTILVCTVMRYLYNFNDMNPEKPNVVLVDYSLAVIMMPTTLAGSQIGTMVLNSFPPVVIQGTLTLVLAFLCYQSYFKACEISAKERNAPAQAKDASAAT